MNSVSSFGLLPSTLPLQSHNFFPSCLTWRWVCSIVCSIGYLIRNAEQGKPSIPDISIALILFESSFLTVHGSPRIFSQYAPTYAEHPSIVEQNYRVLRCKRRKQYRLCWSTAVAGIYFNKQKVKTTGDIFQVFFYACYVNFNELVVSHDYLTKSRCNIKFSVLLPFKIDLKIY